jgi:tRNA(fMet)-specific endonuclease VapC
MRIAIDTNIVTALMRGQLEAKFPLIKLPDELYIPLTVFAEARFGILTGGNPDKYMPVLDGLISRSSVHLGSGITLETAKVYAELRAYLKKHGTPVSPNDLWIAAECVEQNFVLLTLDSDFDKMPQVRRLSI